MKITLTEIIDGQLKTLEVIDLDTLPLAAQAVRTAKAWPEFVVRNNAFFGLEDYNMAEATYTKVSGLNLDLINQ